MLAELSVLLFPKPSCDEEPPRDDTDPPRPSAPPRSAFPALLIYVVLVVALMSPALPYLVKLLIAAILTVWLRMRGAFDE